MNRFVVFFVPLLVLVPSAALAPAQRPVFDASFHKKQLIGLALATILANPVAEAVEAFTSPGRKGIKGDSGVVARSKCAMKVMGTGKAWMGPYAALWKAFRSSPTREGTTKGQMIWEALTAHRAFSACASLLTLDAVVVGSLYLKHVYTDLPAWEMAREKERQEAELAAMADADEESRKAREAADAEYLKLAPGLQEDIRLLRGALGDGATEMPVTVDALQRLRAQLEENYQKNVNKKYGESSESWTDMIASFERELGVDVQDLGKYPKATVLQQRAMALSREKLRRAEEARKKKAHFDERLEVLRPQFEYYMKKPLPPVEEITVDRLAGFEQQIEFLNKQRQLVVHSAAGEVMDLSGESEGLSEVDGRRIFEDRLHDRLKAIQRAQEIEQEIAQLCQKFGYDASSWARPDATLERLEQVRAYLEGSWRKKLISRQTRLEKDLLKDARVFEATATLQAVEEYVLALETEKKLREEQVLRQEQEVRVAWLATLGTHAGEVTFKVPNTPHTSATLAEETLPVIVCDSSYQVGEDKSLPNGRYLYFVKHNGTSTQLFLYEKSDGRSMKMGIPKRFEVKGQDAKGKCGGTSDYDRVVQKIQDRLVTSI